MTTALFPIASTSHSLEESPTLRWLAPIGRTLLAFIFILSAAGHFSRQTIAYAAQQGVPAPELLVPLSGILALVGGLSLALGFHARLGAGLLVLFLVPVTFALHAFWAVPDPMAAQLQQAMFLKNLSILGGILLVALFGAGPVSFDERREARRAAAD